MAAERLDGLAAVLAAIRTSDGITMARLTDKVGWGRSLVAKRVAELETAGLVAPAGLAPSTGGRAPRRVRLRPDAGIIIGAEIGATGMVVGVADPTGTLLAESHEPVDIADGPDVVLARVEASIQELMLGLPEAAPVWGVGIGVPGPVEFSTGRPVSPPIMPGWDRHPIRDRMAARFEAPAWIDNDVNLLALGELRSRPTARDMLYVKVGTGIGAGVVSQRRLHRGAHGCAGDIGHIAVPGAGDVICRCGNVGCLEAIAGGAALVRDGRRMAESGESPALAEILGETGSIRVDDIAVAADKGDPAARAMLTRAGRLVGDTLATLVSFFNPELVVLGGAVAHSGDHVLAAIRETVYGRSLPLATRTLRIEPSSRGDIAGLDGAVSMVLDALFRPDYLALWLPHGSPAGRPEIVAARSVSHA